MTLHDLELILYSGQFMRGAYDYDSLKEILYLLQEGILIHTIANISTVKKYHEIIDKLGNNDIAQIDYEGGSIAHQALKVVAVEYLKQQTIQTDVELPYRGRIPDVITKDRKRIIECGNTDPKKFFDYFDSNVEQIDIIPYPFEDEKVICLHTFIVSNWDAYIVCMKNKKEVDYDPLKSLIQNRRDRFKDN